MTKNLGYAFLHEQLALGVGAPSVPARVRPVTRIVLLEGELAVPAENSPDGSLLSHLLFALKHEGIDLAIPGCGLAASATQ